MSEEENNEAGTEAPADNNAEAPPLNELQDESGEGGTPDIDVILDIPVTLSMEVGKTDITVGNLLSLNKGSVIELDKLAGEALDVYVNGRMIAHGEVVVLNEKFGIRLTDVLNKKERLQQLNT